jgi:hypothetical protein
VFGCNSICLRSKIQFIQVHHTGSSGANVSLQTDHSGPLHQRRLGEWGTAPASTSEISVVSSSLTSGTPALAAPAGPRVDYVIPEPDPNQIIDYDDLDLEDPLALMGDGQGQDDFADDENKEDLSTQKNSSSPICQDCL